MFSSHRRLRVEFLEERRLLAATAIPTWQSLQFDLDGTFSGGYVSGEVSDTFTGTYETPSDILIDCTGRNSGVGTGQINGQGTGTLVTPEATVPYTFEFSDSGTVEFNNGRVTLPDTFGPDYHYTSGLEGSMLATIFGNPFIDMEVDMTLGPPIPVEFEAPVGLFGIYTVAGDFDLVPKSPASNDIVPVNVTGNEGTIAFDLIFDNGYFPPTDLDTPVTMVQVAWATGTSAVDVIPGAPTEEIDIYWNQDDSIVTIHSKKIIYLGESPSADPSDSLYLFDLPGAEFLENKPAEATHMLILIDPNDTVVETNESNNVFAYQWSALPEPPFSGILYVDAASVEPSPTGESWWEAFNNLDDALLATQTRNEDADPDNNVGEIWIAQGTYTPARDVNGVAVLEDGDPGNDRTATFTMLDGVNLYGGFFGSEAVPGERIFDPLTGEWMFETILSGDLQGDDASSIDVADLATHASRADNVLNVLAAPGETSSRLDGLTITGGAADNAGGGIINAGSLLVTRSTISGNSSDNGGGIYNVGSLEMTLSWLLNNQAVTFGGGIFNQGDAKIANTTVNGNQAGSNGAGMYALGVLGGASIVNSTFAGNAATLEGGAIYVDNGPIEILSSTLSGNLAATGGGLSVNPLASESLSFQNSIIARNSGSVSSPDASGDFSTWYVFAYENLIGDGDGVVGLTHLDYGNIIGTATAPYDPLFERNPSPGADALWGTADDDYGDLRLSPLSYAIDQGESRNRPRDLHDLDGDGNRLEPLPLDLDGEPRVFGANMDMGAYESQSSATDSDYILITAFADQVVVTTNGVPETHPIDPPLDLTIDVGVGLDHVAFVGSDGDENATSRPGSLTIEGPDFTIQVDNAERHDLDAGPGSDQQIAVFDSPSNDRASISPLGVDLSGGVYRHRATGFQNYTIIAQNGGYDLAYFQDSTNADSFISSPQLAVLATPDARLSTLGFDNVVCIASEGGSDQALIRGSQGNDFLKLQGGVASISTGVGRRNVVIGFEAVTVEAGAGRDSAVLNGATPAENFVSTTVQTTIAWAATSSTPYFTANNFDYMRMVGAPNDFVDIYDSSRNDRLVTDDEAARLYSDVGVNEQELYVLAREAYLFGLVNAHGTNGGTNEKEEIMPNPLYVEYYGTWVDL